jgi:hypothetical protein
MRTSYAHPAERARGCCLSLVFPDMATVQAQSGVCTGSVQFDSARGIALDGINDYVQYGAGYIGQPFITGFWGAAIEFTPNFTLADAGNKYLYSSVAPRLSFIQINKTSDKLLVYTGNTTKVYDLALASVTPYWRAYQRNVLVVTANSVGAQIVYLNGVSLGMQSIAWTAGYTISTGGIVVGERLDDTGRFPGYIHSVKFFRHQTAAELLTAQEAQDFYQRSTYQYRSRASVILNMGAEQHDVESNPTGVQLLVDGDMEAVGTASYTADNDAVLTKETDTPYAGTRYLKLTRGPTASPGAYQTIAVVGARYRVTGYVKASVAVAFSIKLGATVLTLPNTTTGWVAFSADGIATTNTRVTLLALLANPGDWFALDNVVVERYWCRSLDTSGRGNHFLLGDGSTAGMMPTKLSGRGYSFDGIGADVMKCALSTLVAPPFTAIAIYRSVMTVMPGAGARIMCVNCGNGSTGVNASIYTDFTLRALHETVAWGTAGPKGTDGTYKLVGITSSGAPRTTNLFVGPSATVLSTYTGAVSELPGLTLGGVFTGTAGAAFTGTIHYFALYPMVLTPIQIANEFLVATRGLNRPG